MKIDYKKRLVALEGEIEKRAIDSFFVTKEVNVTYLSGFRGHDSMLLITPRKRYFITDSRYIDEAKESVSGFEIKPVEASTYDTVKDIARKGRLETLGFESMDLPYEVAKRLKGVLGKTRLRPIKNMVESLRAVKDSAEILLIRDSIRLTKKVLNRTLAHIKPGVSEETLAREMELEFLKNGSHPSFELIVASGPNSSKPHARPSEARIPKNGSVMVDLGCKLKGYNSDLTRMILVGMVKDEIKKMYNIVRLAQQKAIDRIKPGVRISDVDSAARGYIDNEGYGRYFGHAVGHGIGMEVHEGPSISRHSEGALRPGMVFTVEPAIYIPKLGGVRIEDMVLVTRDGCEVLTR